MRQLIVGSLAAALAMFMLGFVFYGTPVQNLGWRTATPATQSAIQQALKALPETGTYVIPSGETPEAMAAYAAGPIAQIQYNGGGFAMMDPVSFAGGYVQMAVSVFLVGCVLRTAVVSVFATRARLVLGIAATAVVYLHFAGPVWYHTDWRNALYVAVADFVILGTGGLILARWFVAPSVEQPEQTHGVVERGAASA